MKFTFSQKRTIAVTTLFAIAVVLLLALNFSGCTTSYGPDSLGRELVTAADSIGQTVSLAPAKVAGENHGGLFLPQSGDAVALAASAALLWVLPMMAGAGNFVPCYARKGTPVALSVRLNR